VPNSKIQEQDKNNCVSYAMLNAIQQIIPSSLVTAQQIQDKWASITGDKLIGTGDHGVPWSFLISSFNNVMAGFGASAKLTTSANIAGLAAGLDDNQRLFLSIGFGGSDYHAIEIGPSDVPGKLAVYDSNLETGVYVDANLLQDLYNTAVGLGQQIDPNFTDPIYIVSPAPMPSTGPKPSGGGSGEKNIQ
jgi:hypothetical protein